MSVRSSSLRNLCVLIVYNIWMHGSMSAFEFSKLLMRVIRY